MVLMILAPVRTACPTCLTCLYHLVRHPWHTVPLLQRKKKLPYAELSSVNFMTLEMVHIFLLKEYKERKNMKNGFLQTKKKSVGKWPHSFVLANPLELSTVRIWGELTACLVILQIKKLKLIK